MNLLEVKQEIGAQLNDPSLETYDSRAQAAFIRAMTSLIKADDYVPEDIPSLYIMKRNFYLGETLNQNLVATGAKWVASGDFIEEYCKAGKINKVMVEVEEIIVQDAFKRRPDYNTYRPKTDSNNCIIIHRYILRYL